MFKKKIAKLEDVAEHLRFLYAKNSDEDAGGYVLDTDKALEYAGNRVNEFRTTNINTKKEIEALQTKMETFKGLDPAKYAEYKTAADKLQSINDQGLLDEGKVDEVINRRVDERVGTMKDEFETRLSTAQTTIEDLTGKHATAKKRLSTTLVENTFKSLISDVATVKKGAMDDVMARCAKKWEVDDETGSLKSKDLFDANGDPIQDPSVYVQQLVQSAGFLFEAASGGGAGGSGGGKGGGGKQKGGITWIDNDPTAIGKNLAGIKDGTVKVRGFGAEGG